MMRQMCAPKQVQRAKHQHQAVERAQNPEIVPVTGQRDSMDVLVQQHANPVMN